MLTPSPGDPILYCVDGGLTCHAEGSASSGDIPIRGWLTTEKKNSYGQVVRSSIFDWDGGLTRWNGRILKDHGQRILVGGGENTPVGQITKHSFIPGEGMFGSGILYKENSEQYKRAVREGTINGLSIGFTVENDGWKAHKKTKTEDAWLEFTKGRLFEVSTVNVGANDQALFEVLNSIAHGNTEPNYKHDYLYVVLKGNTYLVNRQGDIIDA